MLTPNTVIPWIKTPVAVYPTTTTIINLQYVAKVSLHKTIDTRVLIRYAVGAGIGQVDKIDFVDNATAVAFIASVEDAVSRSFGITDLS